MNNELLILLKVLVIKDWLTAFLVYLFFIGNSVITYNGAFQFTTSQGLLLGLPLEYWSKDILKW